MAGSSQTPTTDVGGSGIATRIVEIAVAYLTVIGFLFYPIGLLVLAAQLWNAYSYGLSDALFAASLVPIASSAGRVFDFLSWGFISMGIAQAIAAAIAMRRTQEHFVATIAPMFPAAEREDLVKEEERRLKHQRTQNLLIVLLTLTAPYALQLILLNSWRAWVLYIAFVTLTCIGGGATGLLLLFSGNSPYASLIGDWRALLVSFAFAIPAGIALTGTSLPSLPVISYEAESAQEEGRLLAHTEGYWYIFDSQGTLKAIPNDDAGDVEFLRHEPQSNSK